MSQHTVRGPCRRGRGPTRHRSVSGDGLLAFLPLIRASNIGHFLTMRAQGKTLVGERDEHPTPPYSGHSHQGLEAGFRLGEYLSFLSSSADLTVQPSLDGICTYHTSSVGHGVFAHDLIGLRTRPSWSSFRPGCWLLWHSSLGNTPGHLRV